MAGHALWPRNALSAPEFRGLYPKMILKFN